MKTSKLLVTSLLAAAAMSTVPAFAEDYITPQEITALPADSINVSGNVVLTYKHNGNNSTSGDVLTSLSVTIGEGATFADLTNYKYYFTLTGPLSGGGILLSKVPSESSQGDGFRKVTISGDASDFTGTWVLESASSTYSQRGGGNRKIFGELATGSFGGVVKFEPLTGGNAPSMTVPEAQRYSYLNIAVASASIAGLEGEYGVIVGGATLDGGDRSTVNNTGSAALTIALTGNATHTFSGTIDSSISTLTISGSGTQAISGKINAGSVVVESGAGLDLSGGTITLASAIDNAGSVTFSSSSVVEIGALGGTIFDTAQSGRLAVSENFTIATGTGSVYGLTASGIRVNGFTYASMTVADDYKSVAVDSAVYNIASGSTATISEVTNAGTVDFINVLGTLTGLGSTSTTTPIYGTGTVSVDTGLLEYHDKTFLETFEGILSISGTGEVRLGNAGSTKLTKVSKVTVSTGGTLSFWAGTFSRAVELSGGTLKSGGGDIGFSGSVTVASASTIDTSNDTHSNGNTITLSGAVTGTGTLTKIGAGTLELTDPTASTVSGAGGIVVEAGTLYLSGNGSGNVSGKHFCVSKDITLKDGTFLKWRDADQASRASYQYELSGALTVEGNTTITGATNYAKEVALLGNLSGSGTLNFYRGNSDSNFNSNGRLIIAGADNSGFTGTVVIGGQTTVVSQGLDLNADLANGTISLQGGSGQPAYMRVLKSATIKGLNGNAKSSIGIGNVLAGDSVGAYTLTVGEGNFAGTIEDNGEARQYGETSSSKVTGAVLSLVKQGSGTLVLSGHNTYSGGTTIKQGVLVAGSASALGTTKGVEVQSGATLNLGALAVTVAGLSGAGSVGLANGTTSSTLTVDSASDSTFSGSISGDMSVVKTGAGTQEFSGVFTLLGESDNAKSVSVQEGMLKLHLDTGSTPFVGSISVSSGSSLGVVAASNSYFGVAATTDGGYTYDGSISFDVGGKLVVDLNSVVVVDGATEIALKILTSSAISFAGTDVASMTLTDATLGGFVEFIDTDGVFSEFEKSWVYAPDEWNNSTLFLTMTIPEPSAFGLLAGAGALALVAARRRRTKKA